MFVRVFEYEAAPGQQQSFEAAYGRNGEWAQLFAGAAGYVETTLETDDQGGYRTQDVWLDATSFDRFLVHHREAYDALDLACRGLKAAERHVSDLASTLPPTGRWRPVPPVLRGP